MSHAVVNLDGRAVRDADIKETKTGKKVCNFTLAVSSASGRNDASFFDIEAWNDIAEVSAEITKGLRVELEGNLKQERWTADNGKNNSRIKIVAKKVTLYPNKIRVEQTA